MSDSVTNVEIEDVLSSIRKLVSDDQRAPEKGAPKPAAPVDRLVLTPDFRVEEDEEVNEISGEDDDVEADELLVEETVQSGSDDHADVSEDDSAYFEDSEDALEFDAVLDAETIVPEDALDADDAFDSTLEPPAAGDVEADPEPEDIGPEPIAEADPLASRIAELEAAVAQQSEDWDPDGIDESDENTPEDVASSVVEMWETVEPDDIPISEPEIEPTLEAEEIEETDPADDADETFASFATEDDARLDEEALRDMVSELVRQELQGALGARITRNVRKLVRREIYRIMDSKDFE